MDKSITAYYDRTKHAVESLRGVKSRAKAEELYLYHIDRVRDFQHERLIHLLVTFFFSVLLIMSIIGLLWAGESDINSGNVLVYLFLGAGIILFITVLFYVRHYYLLENTTQKLYTLTEQLHRIME